MCQGNFTAHQPWNSATDDLRVSHWDCLADLVQTSLPEGPAQPASLIPREKLLGALSRSPQPGVSNLWAATWPPRPGHLQRRGAGTLPPHHPPPTTCPAIQGAEGEGHRKGMTQPWDMQCPPTGLPGLTRGPTPPPEEQRLPSHPNCSDPGTRAHLCS